jgi:hypothetical protein
MTGILAVSVFLNALLIIALLIKRESRNWMDGIKEADVPLPQGIHRPAFRRFVFDRKVDVTGISGTGIRVEGVVFSDGWGVSHWLDMPPMNEPKTEVWHNPGVAPLVKISGHNGASEVVWLDRP